MDCEKRGNCRYQYDELVIHISEGQESRVKSRESRVERPLNGYRL